jgi:hypothetical protein
MRPLIHCHYLPSAHTACRASLVAHRLHRESNRCGGAVAVAHAAHGLRAQRGRGARPALLLASQARPTRRGSEPGYLTSLQPFSCGSRCANSYSRAPCQPLLEQARRAGAAAELGRVQVPVEQAKCACMDVEGAHATLTRARSPPQAAVWWPGGVRLVPALGQPAPRPKAQRVRRAGKRLARCRNPTGHLPAPHLLTPPHIAHPLQALQRARAPLDWQVAWRCGRDRLGPQRGSSRGTARSGSTAVKERNKRKKEKKDLRGTQSMRTTVHSRAQSAPAPTSLRNTAQPTRP